MTEIINKVLGALTWNPSDILKPKRGSCKAITALEFIDAVLNTNSIPEAATAIGVSNQTLNRLVAKYLVPVFGKKQGGNQTWKLVLLTNTKIKKCSNCHEYLDHIQFTKDLSTFDGLDKKCKSCKSVVNATFYEQNKEVYHKPYIDTHRHEYNARNAKRRAAKLQATAAWADLEKIKSIYENCPKGYHVDHIYPLISDWVCGLHVENNLQYLSAIENSRKGNRRDTGDW